MICHFLNKRVEVTLSSVIGQNCNHRSNLSFPARRATHGNKIAPPYCSIYIYIGRPQNVVYPPHITCFSMYCSTYFFIGRPRFVVYPPRTICCHVYLYASILVNHDLWSTFHALYVTTFICTYVIR